MQKPSYFSQYGGFNSLLKNGYRHFKGKEQTLMKNVDAICDMAQMTRINLNYLIIYFGWTNLILKFWFFIFIFFLSSIFFFVLYCNIEYILAIDKYVVISYCPSLMKNNLFIFWSCKIYIKNKAWILFLSYYK